MKFVVKDKVVIITGASSGIGAATAIELARRGSKVVLAARNESKLAAVTTQCKEHSESTYVVTDITRPEECKWLIDQTVQRHGRIDVLISNAGLSMRALAEDCSMDVYHRLMDVNFFGGVYCITQALPHLLASRGMIVGISSVSGFKALPGRSGYAAGKSAINGFLEAIKIENIKTGLHVLTVCPGFTASNIRVNALDQNGHVQGFTPRDEKKMMSAEEVAKHVVKAMETKKHFLVLTKEGKIILWLNKFFPNLVSKLIFNEMAKEPDSPLRMQPINPNS